jgi:hypothetical protein
MNGLESTITTLTDRVNALLAANADLRAQLADLRNSGGAATQGGDIISADSATPARDAAWTEEQRERLDELVREIDKCLAILNN